MQPSHSLQLKKIAYIRDWSGHPSNVNMTRAVAEAFPEYPIELIEMSKWLKRRPDLLIINALFILFYYGWTIFSQKLNAQDYVYATPFLFKQIKKMIVGRIEKNKGQYVFTFQPHSLFDASVPGLPHFVYTDHTVLANLDYPDYDPKRLFCPAWIELEKTIYYNANMVFTRSSNISMSVVEKYGYSVERVTCVYAGSNAQVTTELPDNADYRNKEILFVGSNWIWKGGPELAQAFALVLKVHSDAHLTIVGCIPPTEIPNCTVVGRIPINQVHQYYSRASIFCLPTKLEPFGIAFVEALSHHLPVVATNIGAIPDFVQEGVNGFMVESGNIELTARRLIELLDSPDTCRAFGEKGYQLAMERYTWKNVGASIRRSIDRLGLV